jgi:hypothetical protein
LQILLDNSIESEMYIRSFENQIQKEAYSMQKSILEKNSNFIVQYALSIAKSANRITQLANQEAENSEDLDYVNRILASNEALKLTLPPMIQLAKSLAIDPSNKDAYLMWTNANENVIFTSNKF